MAVVVITDGPDAEPVLKADFKKHARITFTDDDDYIDSLIKVARQMCEHVTRQKFITQTLKLYRDRFPRSRTLELQHGPTQEISSIEYYDTNNTLTEFSSSKYSVDTQSMPARIRLNSGESWPSVKDRPHAVIITYVVGYGDAGSDVPEDLQHAVTFMTRHLYENREPVVVAPSISIQELPMGIQFILGPHRIF